MMNGICDSCAGLRRTSEPKSHHCAGMGCQCGSCNEIVVAYNSGALAYLRTIAPIKNFGLVGFGVFNLLGAIASTYGGSSLVWVTLIIGTSIYMIQAVKNLGR